ncbi:MAG: NUDIX hydrolase [Aestuariivirgaceae bacterium]
MRQAVVQPVAAVSVCVVRDGHVLLAKRANQKAFGLWSLPGGHVELGEPLRTAALRELAEETGVTARIVRLLDCIDVIHKTRTGEVESHYVLSVFGAQWVDGEACASSDASEVQWVNPTELDRFQMTPGTSELIRRVVPVLTEI